MNQSLDKALYYLTGHETIYSVTVEELEKLVSDNPYFPVAHFLLAKKLKEEHDDRFLKHVQKTALYFPNPHWLHYQLLNDLPNSVIVHESTVEEIVEPIDKANRQQDEQVEKDTTREDEPSITTLFGDEEIETTEDSYNEDPVNEQRESADARQIENLDAIIVAEKQDEQQEWDEQLAAQKINVEIAETQTGQREEVDQLKGTAPVNIGQEEIGNVELTNEPTSIPAANHIVEEDLKATANEPPLANNEPNALVEIKDANAQLHLENLSQPEEEMAAITRGTDETSEQFLNELEEPGKDDELLKEVLPIEETITKEQRPILRESEAEETFEIEPGEVDEHEQMFQNIKAMLDASVEDANASTKETVVPIDPYYTIDYFASQGIKVDLEKNPQDKLGKQVKKFTQWLKHMKKIGPEDSLASESISPAEIEAQRVADASNTAREVVTEAMALVLEKQGKKDKAIQLYKKLTFLNPHKSSYFADKIKNLNGT